MKKIRIVVFGFATLLILAGCQRSEVSEDAQSVETTASTSIEATSLIEESTATTESSASSQQNALEEFEEAPIIEKTIDVSDLQLNIETDNPNKRVLFFSTDTGQKRYKSVFVKRTERLKIIDLSDEGILYNREIN
ncbi:hypothetical protein DOK78_000656 [Enterococcus sp. DIV2402]|uniref:Lipoprotein n=1 Tax=Candidatus Enterococcus lowellii TaxID=2230877 RepID=A0ABZ2SQA2_9ENTE|nr:hypothetical protein [Enterococcus sp. DIV2402]MBO0465548.1 hypothetical protein [Enterococcus sp. DIV2402]